jgi:hypothetical protein
MRGFPPRGSERYTGAMPHRDDREALNAKLEAQARELAEAKEENDRLRAQNARKATELERIRALAPPGAAPEETAEPQAGARDGGQAPPVHAMHQPLTHHPLSPDIRRQLGGLMIATSLLVGGLSLSAVRLAGSGAHCHRGGCPLTQAAAAASVHTTFPASIVEASGTTAHAEGEPCLVDATFDVDGRSQLHTLTALTIACADQTIYAPVAGSLDGAGVAWTAETPGRARYELVVRDSSSATTVDIDSWDGRARVEGDGWILELDIAPLSAEVDMPIPLAAPSEAVVVRAGHVIDASGLAVGTACTVARHPAGMGGYSDRVVVRCGGHTLYGAGQTGYTYPSRDPRLSVDENVSSEDGDARMTLDLVQNEVHLEDGLGLVAQHVDIALD